MDQKPLLVGVLLTLSAVRVRFECAVEISRPATISDSAENGILRRVASEGWVYRGVFVLHYTPLQRTKVGTINAQNAKRELQRLWFCILSTFLALTNCQTTANVGVGGSSWPKFSSTALRRYALLLLCCWGSAHKTTCTIDATSVMLRGKVKLDVIRFLEVAQ